MSTTPPPRRGHDRSISSLRVPSVTPSESSPSKIIRKISMPDLSAFAAKKVAPSEWAKELKLAIKGLVYNWIIQIKAGIELYRSLGKGETKACKEMEDGVRDLWSLWKTFTNAKAIDGSVLIESPLFYDFWPQIHRLIKPRDVGGKEARDTMERLRGNCNKVRQQFSQLTRIVVEMLVRMDAFSDEDLELDSSDKMESGLDIPDVSGNYVELPETIRTELNKSFDETQEAALLGEESPRIQFRMITNVPAAPVFKLIQGDHPAAKSYRSLRYAIIHYMSQVEAPYTLTLLLRDGRPTIVIIVEASITTLTLVEEDIQELLNYTCGNDIFDIQVSKGFVGLGIDRRVAECRGYHEKVPNGASIGIEKLPHAAFSLGFYIKIRNDPDGDIYAITAGHNVAKWAPAVDKDFPENEMNETFEEGTKVYQPALADIEENLRQQYKNRTEYQRKERQALEEGRRGQAYLSQSYATDAQQVIDELEKLKKNPAKLLFGTLTKYSELGPSNDVKDQLVKGQQYLYDYAIIKVIPARAAENQISEHVENIGRKKVAGTTEVKMNKTKMVVKWGRTTGYTGGKVNTIEADVGGLARFPKQTFAFHNVLSISSAMFVDQGDSGAAISTEDDGDGIALVQGVGRSEKVRSENKHTRDVTFVLDIERTLKRIKHKFGVDFEVICFEPPAQQEASEVLK